MARHKKFRWFWKTLSVLTVFAGAWFILGTLFGTDILAAILGIVGASSWETALQFVVGAAVVTEAIKHW